VFWWIAGILALTGAVAYGGLKVTGSLGAKPQIDPKGSRKGLGDESWLRGEDLKTYPRRLLELERSLERVLESARGQRTHLEGKQREMSAKEGRDDLVQRYTEDIDALDARMAAMRRVLGTVWKTRAILHLRVHLAIVARQRPELDHLPQPLDVQAGELESAAAAYTSARVRVRAFLARVGEGLEDLDRVAPPPPLEATLEDEDRRAVEVELTEVRATLTGLASKMDKLSDDLEYLADRFRTQRVVEGAPLELDLDPGANKVLLEVAGALGQLEQLSAVGDKGLAEAAVDSLTEDIQDLERGGGMDLKAEADAHKEVEKLLQQFRARTQQG
jgi:hypothetical protein